MSFMPTTRGEHVHIRPNRGRLNKHDRVVGHPIVGYEVEDEQYQDMIIVVDGERMTLADLLGSLPANMRAETIPFPCHRGCCEMQYAKGA